MGEFPNLMVIPFGSCFISVLSGARLISFSRSFSISLNCLSKFFMTLDTIELMSLSVIPGGVSSGCDWSEES